MISNCQTQLDVQSLRSPTAKETASALKVIADAQAQTQYLHGALGELDLDDPVEECHLNNDMRLNPSRKQWKPRRGRPEMGDLLAQNIIDRAYAIFGQHTLGKKKIGIKWETYTDGQGDRSTAVKVAKLLSPRADVFVQMPSRTPKESKPFFSFLPVERVLAFAYDRPTCFPSPELPLKLDLCISIPQQDRFNWRETCYFLGEGAYPCLNLREYDSGAAYHHVNSFETGFSLPSCGIFVDHELRRQALNFQATFPSSFRQGWQDIAEHLKLRSLQDKQWIGDTEAVVMHTCYVKTTTLEQSLAAHITSHGTDVRSLAVLIVNGEFRYKTETEWKALLTSADFDGWQVHGSLAGPEDMRGTASSHRALQGLQNRRLEIILTPGLPPQAFTTALKMSAFALVTGDQSLTEAISIGLPIMYDAAYHKITTGKNLSRIAAHQHGASLALGGYLNAPVAGSLGAPLGAQRLSEVFSDLRRYHDVSERLAGRCLRLMIHQNMQRQEEKIFLACNTPGEAQPSPALVRAVEDLGIRLREAR